MKILRQALTYSATRIGVISDTHGLLRLEALNALKGSELIIHAGDVGRPEVLQALGSIATVIAIRGNNDRDAWAKKLPDVVNLHIGGVKAYVIHNVNDLKNDALAAAYQVIVAGHSHKPSVIRRHGTIFINPGSAGPRRFKLPVAVARLEIIGDKAEARIIELKV